MTTLDMCLYKEIRDFQWESMYYAQYEHGWHWNGNLCCISAKDAIMATRMAMERGYTTLREILSVDQTEDFWGVIYD
jgi:hypothetical protein